MSRRAAQAAYAVLFSVVLPVLLYAWAVRLDQLLALPVIAPPTIGVLLAVLGGLLVAWAVIALRVLGGGWPMSPFPPARRVTRGPYALVDNPIYAGAALLVLGAAIGWRSGSGVWIVAPLFAAACAAFVIGYEKEATDAHFGPRPTPPMLRLPAAADDSPSGADRISIYVLVFLPWYLAYEGVNALGVPRDAMRLSMRWDDAIPVLGWTEPLYFLTYPLLLALPLVIRTQRELRRFAQQGWVAIVSITTIYLVLPASIDAKPVPEGSLFAPLMQWERAFDDHATGFPAFHVVWACIAAVAYSRAVPRLRQVWWLTAGAITVSCVTAGMHVLLDVAGAVVATLFVLNAERLWRATLRVAERTAASWREWDLGAVRFLSYGIYAAAGGLAGVLIIGSLAGQREIVAVSVVAIASIAGAGLWAQFIEGSPALQRPYGFYGGLFGAMLAIAMLPLLGSNAWLVFAAYSVGTPIVQACGRVRCLVQGCCHGRASAEHNGIRYTHPRSRVTRLSGLAGAPLHATQVYSILWSIFSFILLARLWVAGGPLSFIVGAFFVFNGLGRFVEEHFRGEPQTPIVGGLRVYQWLAIGSVVAGAIFTTIRTPAAPPANLPSAATWIAGLAIGVVAYVAYGVDFPRLNARFARLV